MCAVWWSKESDFSVVIRGEQQVVAPAPPPPARVAGLGSLFRLSRVTEKRHFLDDKSQTTWPLPARPDEVWLQARWDILNKSANHTDWLTNVFIWNTGCCFCALQGLKAARLPDDSATSYNEQKNSLRRTYCIHYIDYQTEHLWAYFALKCFALYI